ncbi:MAG: hypothetical protein KF729_11425 [Sandaracinaceae bacterium]|nr:hypothetical protein [Sandaracinaceae bacterium]
MRLIETLKERSARLAEGARGRGIDALGKVRAGTLDWHRTLEARRAELEQAERPRWLTSIGSLQLLFITRVDRALEVFGDRVREEIARLAKLELGAGAPKPAPRGKTAAKKRAAARAGKADGKPSRRLVMPIAGYDELSAKDALAEIARLTPAQCAVVREHERSNKNRKTVLKALDARAA